MRVGLSAGDYALLRATLAPEAIKAAYPRLIRGRVRCYEMAHLGGVNVVLEEALESGVNSSLDLDAHGKSWSYLILALPLQEE